jgi:hypothetical protein
MAPAHAKKRQQRDTILSELSYRVAVFRLAGPARAAAIKNDRSKPLRVPNGSNLLLQVVGFC